MVSGRDINQYIATNYIYVTKEIILYNIVIMNKQKQENNCPLRCASLRGVEFFPHGKRGERAQRLGQFFSCLYLLPVHFRYTTGFDIRLRNNENTA